MYGSLGGRRRAGRDSFRYRKLRINRAEPIRRYSMHGSIARHKWPRSPVRNVGCDLSPIISIAFSNTVRSGL